MELSVAAVERNANSADSEVRVCRRIEVGQAIQQGDVYVFRMPDDWPRAEEPWGSKQVAVGDTQGSRHVACGDVRVWGGKELPEWFTVPSWLGSKAAAKSVFLGPVIEARGKWTLEHPEHAHHVCPPGVYQVTYQGDVRVRARVMD